MHNEDLSKRIIITANRFAQTQTTLRVSDAAGSIAACMHNKDLAFGIRVKRSTKLAHAKLLYGLATTYCKIEQFISLPQIQRSPLCAISLQIPCEMRFAILGMPFAS